MITAARRSLPPVLFSLGAVLGFVGISGNDLIPIAAGSLLVLLWAVYELRHPVNRRRTFAARPNLWLMPVTLALIVLIWVVWGLPRST